MSVLTVTSSSAGLPGLLPSRHGPRQGLWVGAGALGLPGPGHGHQHPPGPHQAYLEGEAGVDRLEAALIRIREEEFDLLPS